MNKHEVHFEVTRTTGDLAVANVVAESREEAEKIAKQRIEEGDWCDIITVEEDVIEVSISFTHDKGKHHVQPTLRIVS